MSFLQAFQTSSTILAVIFFLFLIKEYVDVRCIEAFNSGISVDEEFSVTKDVVSEGGAPELNVDDNIRVVFNGDVMESDPLQIGTVYAIYLLDENGEVIPNN